MTVFSIILYIFIALFILFFLLVRYTSFTEYLQNFLTGSIDKLDAKIEELDNQIAQIEAEECRSEYLKLKRYIGKKVHKGFVVTVEFSFEHRECSYILTCYKNFVSFKRKIENDIEVKFLKMDDFYSAEQVDSICFKRDWKKLKEWEIDCKKLPKNQSQVCAS